MTKTATLCRLVNHAASRHYFTTTARGKEAPPPACASDRPLRTRGHDCGSHSSGIHARQALHIRLYYTAMERYNKSFLDHLAGLRGLAIILVVLFHLDSQTWAHGYLGVDIFLVITGYLLVRGRMKQGGRESMGESLRYLWRRMQRIIPSMAVLIIIVLLLGALILYWEDEIFLGKFSYRTCQLKGNIYLARELSDYFGAESAFNPLLHTWYLSVILQVYLLYAGINRLIQGLGKKLIIGLLSLVGAASLAYALFGEASYYATLPRLWEVLAGGLVCLLPSLSKRRAWATAAAALGLLGMLLPAVFGILPYTAVAVAGAVLALRYLPESHIERALSNAPLKWIGGISFSVYLVHMPLIVFWRIWQLGTLSIADDLLILAITLPLGWIFWWGVEKRRCSWWGVVLLWGAAILLSRAVYKTNGFENYLPTDTYDNRPYTAWSVSNRTDIQAELSPFFLGNRGVFRYMHQDAPTPTPLLLAMGESSQPASVVLLGDSHAMCLYPGLDDALRREGLGGFYLSSIVLPFRDYNYDYSENYFFTPEKSEALLTSLAAHPELTHVIIAQRWWSRYEMMGADTFEQKLRSFISALRQAGKQVILMAPYPEFFQNSPVHYQRAAIVRGLSADDISPTCTRAQYLAQHGTVLSALLRLQEEGLCTVLNLHRTLREDEDFHASQGRTLYMNDSNHLNSEGAIWIMQQLMPQLRPLLKPDAPPAQP